MPRVRTPAPPPHSSLLQGYKPNALLATSLSRTSTVAVKPYLNVDPRAGAEVVAAAAAAAAAAARAAEPEVPAPYRKPHMKVGRGRAPCVSCLLCAALPQVCPRTTTTPPPAHLPPVRARSPPPPHTHTHTLSFAFDFQCGGGVLVLDLWVQGARCLHPPPSPLLPLRLRPPHVVGRAPERVLYRGNRVCRALPHTTLPAPMPHRLPPLPTRAGSCRAWGCRTSTLRRTISRRTVGWRTAGPTPSAIRCCRYRTRPHCALRVPQRAPAPYSLTGGGGGRLRRRGRGRGAARAPPCRSLVREREWGRGRGGGGWCSAFAAAALVRARPGGRAHPWPRPYVPCVCIRARVCWWTWLCGPGRCSAQVLFFGHRFRAAVSTHACSLSGCITCELKFLFDILSQSLSMSASVRVGAGAWPRPCSHWLPLRPAPTHPACAPCGCLRFVPVTAVATPTRAL